MRNVNANREFDATRVEREALWRIVNAFEATRARRSDASSEPRASHSDARAMIRAISSRSKERFHGFTNALLVIKTSKEGSNGERGEGELRASEASERAKRVSERKRTHDASVCAVKEILERHGVRSTSVEREMFDVKALEGVDLVLALGGDGTTLIAAHAMGRSDVPIMGINTDPATTQELSKLYLTNVCADERRSTGHLCAANRFDAESVLTAALRGDIEPTRLARIRTTINGRELEPALNDVLIAHPSPAAVSRYSLKLQGKSDAYFHVRSSGLRTCTASGSTAAMYSAGGRLMPFDSTEMQYMDREPIYYDHAPPPSSAGHRFYKRGETMRLRWNSRVGVVYIDGAHVKHDISLGDDIEMSSDGPELSMFVSPWFKKVRELERMRVRGESSASS